VLCSDPAQRLVAAELVARHDGTPWQPLLLAVDFKGATVMVHPVETST
jgi:homoserine kinase